MMEQKTDRPPFDQYILVGPGSDYGRAMWNDIDLMENGRVLSDPLHVHNRLLRFFHHLHFSFAINNHVQLPFQAVWEGHYSLDEIRLDPKKQYCVIYTDNSAGRTGISYLRKLHERENVKLVLVVVNTMARRHRILQNRLPYFDLVYSFDKKDALQYGFSYYPTNYSVSGINRNAAVENDAFFVGVSKNRQSLLEQVYQKLNAAGAKCAFYISGVQTKTVQGIHYNEWLTYSQVLQNIEKTNCVVEVMEDGQNGVTLRAMEAICFNKRLLTNNQSVKDLKFYQTGYIQVFDKAENIDPEFVLDRSPVDYGYNNEFSPIHLIEHIEEQFKTNLTEKENKL